MTRLPAATSRAPLADRSRLWWFVALIGIATLAGTGRASAQTAEASPPKPTIVSAPDIAGFRADAVIIGKLRHGTSGEVLALQRQEPSGAWTEIARKAINDRLKVRFERGDLKRTSFYRLVWADPAGGTSKSASHRIAVRPKLTLHAAPSDVMVGKNVRLSGLLYPAVSGRRVRIEQRVNGKWRTIGKDRVRDGEFSLRVTTRRKGWRLIRVTFGGDRQNLRARHWDWFKVYDPDLATWYGPGFYGNNTACGQVLRTDTLGVAHRTLPCGTKIGVLYKGRTITVKVIDRGPFTSAEWDLTEATARKLRFDGRRTIGTVH